MSQIIGPITASGFAAASTLTLVVGLRGSDRIPLRRDTAGVLGFATGSLWLGAGTTWVNLANDVHEIPSSLLGSEGYGDLGTGGTLLCMAILTFGPKWKKMIMPALLGISLAVAAKIAGGLGGVAVNWVVMMSGKLG
ncbi:hypothetical protein [Kitasatospora aureofaciens]|uniref:hypothetical protein n=1 Tax=Kitasatospora aureofaciens TaxID=1894 RepID=UPI0033C1942F